MTQVVLFVLAFAIHSITEGPDGRRRGRAGSNGAAAASFRLQFHLEAWLVSG
ncbi:hypothetical protein [Haloterrigena salifodinae]|uniref:hypothetical protein n=1 Tax=Haloterrigena salifodinae TaxID=2675099 RepID=UPI0013DFC5EE|nr:hypothetical protein [Haloterrigena salifodinae]